MVTGSHGYKTCQVKVRQEAWDILRRKRPAGLRSMNKWATMVLESYAFDGEDTEIEGIVKRSDLDAMKTRLTSLENAVSVLSESTHIEEFSLPDLPIEESEHEEESDSYINYHSLTKAELRPYCEQFNIDYDEYSRVQIIEILESIEEE